MWNLFGVATLTTSSFSFASISFGGRVAVRHAELVAHPRSGGSESRSHIATTSACGMRLVSLTCPRPIPSPITPTRSFFMRLLSVSSHKPRSATMRSRGRRAFAAISTRRPYLLQRLFVFGHASADDHARLRPADGVGDDLDDVRRRSRSGRSRGRGGSRTSCRARAASSSRCGRPRRPRTRR